MADGLADWGYTVLAPDLNFGELPGSEEDAVDRLLAANPDRLASLVLSSTQVLSEKAVNPNVAIVGFGMGGSLGLWASVRLHSIVDKMVSFYGTQQIDFAGSQASYLIHLAEDDEYITDDEAAFMEATMGLEDLSVEVRRYPATRHGFADRDGDFFDLASFESAWATTLEFLAD